MENIKVVGDEHMRIPGKEKKKSKRTNIIKSEKHIPHTHTPTHTPQVKTLTKNKEKVHTPRILTKRRYEIRYDGYVNISCNIRAQQSQTHLRKNRKGSRSSEVQHVYNQIQKFRMDQKKHAF
jgi:hypothetical protein